MKVTVEQIREALFSGKRVYDIPLRVTYYARVSTDETEQLSSLNHQVQYFTGKIRENPNWTYVQGYVDEGISGTRIDKRPQFMQMLKDANDGRFDLILTKEVSRFARDIVDTVQTTRDLLRIHVGVLFEDIQLNTFEPDAEFRLSIMATVAQEESRKISERVRFGYKQASRAGKRHGARAPIGYTFNNENNGFAVDPATAPIVKYVFDTYASGKAGLKRIGLNLAGMGYLNANGRPYSSVTLRRMIENPTYTGHITNGKSYKESYRSDRIVMKPKTEWKLHYDPARVPPLVSDAVWQRANEVLRQKRERYKENARSKTPFGPMKFAYSGRIFCAEHHTAFVHAVGTWKRADGRKNSVGFWRCGAYKNFGRKACAAPAVYDRDLNAVFRDLFSGLKQTLENASHTVAGVLDAMLCSDAEEGLHAIRGLEAQRESLFNKKARLLDGWAEGVISSKDYKIASERLDLQIAQLDSQIMRIKKENGRRDALSRHAAVMRDVMRITSLEADEAVHTLVRALVEKILVQKCEDGDAYALEIYLVNNGVPVRRLLVKKTKRAGESRLSPL